MRRSASPPEVGTAEAAPARARVIVLAGPSGSGKSRLAGRLRDEHGWPIVNLDDFYRDHDHPDLPRHEALGIVDWDHVDSWDGGAALAALEELVTTGRTEKPVYDISSSRATGVDEVTCRPDDLVIAEKEHYLRGRDLEEMNELLRAGAREGGYADEIPSMPSEMLPLALMPNWPSDWISPIMTGFDR